MTRQEEFQEIYTKCIKREGAKELLAYLEEKSDFFTAPASSRFHLAVEGGLVEHSLNVYRRLKALVMAEYGEHWQNTVSEESVAICALLHDVCKADTYKVDYRNVKNDMGVWEKKPYYAVDDPLPYGHGEKSVYIINGFLRLTREEAMAINWHMGSFDDRAKGGSYAIANAYRRYPLAVMTHLADFSATYLDEGE